LVLKERGGHSRVNTHPDFGLAKYLYRAIFFGHIGSVFRENVGDAEAEAESIRFSSRHGVVRRAVPH
jgi:hypothetical protein